MGLIYGIVGVSSFALTSAGAACVLLAPANDRPAPTQEQWEGVVKFLFGYFLLVSSGLLLWRMVALRRASNPAPGKASIIAVFTTVGFGALSLVLVKVPGGGHFDVPADAGAGTAAVYLLGHLFRAADLLDAVEAYGIRVTRVKPISDLARLTLVCFYGTVSFVAVGVILAARSRRLLRSSTRSMPGPARGPGHGLGRWVGRGVLVAGIGLYVALGCVRGWPPAVWVYWPLEQIARVADMFDCLTHFDTHLVPSDTSVLSGTAALCFRFSVGATLVGLFARLGGFDHGVWRRGTPPPAVPGRLNL